MARVLILDPVDAGLAEELERHGISTQDLSKASAESVESALPDAEAIVVRSRTKVTASMIEHARRLRVIGRAGAGTDNIETAAARARGIEILTVAGGNDRAVAELALAFCFAFARQLVPAVEASRRGEWAKSRLSGFELAGETLGVVGLGKIGKTLAALAHGLGMKVIGFDPFVDPSDWEGPPVENAPLRDLLARSRFISVHVPLSAETRGLIGADELAAMRSDAYLIQCSRGGVVDEEALADALEAAGIAGAGLDVFSNEPEIPSRLAHSPRVLATPHIGASTEQAQIKIARLLAHSLVRFLRAES
jgi:D-3-phosphoglycerate dehydrogenase / 2-oxoglutarate reductase